MKSKSPEQDLLPGWEEPDHSLAPAPGKLGERFPYHLQKIMRQARARDKKSGQWRDIAMGRNFADHIRAIFGVEPPGEDGE